MQQLPHHRGSLAQRGATVIVMSRWFGLSSGSAIAAAAISTSPSAISNEAHEQEHDHERQPLVARDTQPSQRDQQPHDEWTNDFDDVSLDEASSPRGDEMKKRKRLSTRHATLDDASTNTPHYAGEESPPDSTTISNLLPSSSVTAQPLLSSLWKQQFDGKRCRWFHRLRSTFYMHWHRLRLITLLQILGLIIVVIVLLRSVGHKVVETGKNGHYSLVAVLREVHPPSSTADGSNEALSMNDEARTHALVQRLALDSWSSEVRGSHMLMFVDDEASCTNLEALIPDVQCFVLSREKCVHPVYKKPRMDCVLSVAHSHAPTDTIVLMSNGEDGVLFREELSETIRVVQNKRERFVMAGQRRDVEVDENMLRELERKDPRVAVQELMDQARSMDMSSSSSSSSTSTDVSNAVSKDHEASIADSLDLIIYQRDIFAEQSSFESFPPFLANTPYWDAWFHSVLLLNESITSIDFTQSVPFVHLHLHAAAGQRQGVFMLERDRKWRVGAKWNEQFVKNLAGHTWKVGLDVTNNAEWKVVDDCRKGAAIVKEMEQPTESGGSSMLGFGGEDAADTAAAALSSSSDPLALTPGCYLAHSTTPSDFLLLSRRVSRRNDGYIVVLTTNAGYLPLAFQWLCWAERIQLKHYVFVAEDRYSMRKLASKGVPMLHPVPEADLPERIEAAAPRSIDFLRALTFRAQMMLGVLEKGFNFVVSDVDTIWMEDPLKYLDPKADVQAMTVPRTSATTSGAGSGGSNSNGKQSSEMLSSTFLAVRSSLFGRNFWSRIVECHREQETRLEEMLTTDAYQTSSSSSTMNDTSGEGGISLTPEESSIYSVHACLNTIFEALLPDRRFRFRKLDEDLFVSGENFFERHVPQLRGMLPVVIHNDESVTRSSMGIEAALIAGLEKGGQGVFAKVARMVEWGLAAADEESEECIHHTSMPFPTLPLPLIAAAGVRDEPPSFHLKIRILSYNRPTHLRRLLQSLDEAEYDANEAVSLEISIDHPLPTPSEEDALAWSECVSIAHAFTWKHGRKLVIEQSHNIGRMGQWTTGWNPPKDRDDELCLFLEEDMLVSPVFYKWLKHAIQRFYMNRDRDPESDFDENLFGISLQRQNVILGESLRNKFGSRTPKDVLDKLQRNDQYIQAQRRRNKRGKLGVERMSINDDEFETTSSPDPETGRYDLARSSITHLYRYQLLGTGGALFFPQHWRQFLHWLHEKQVDTIQGKSPVMVPCVPTLISNAWWQARPHHSWTQWFIRFAYEKGWYSLYTNFHDGKALAISQRLTERKGSSTVHSSIAGSQPSLLTTLTKEHVSFPPKSHIPLFDFHFRRVSNTRILRYRSAMTNEQFLTTSQSVLDDSSASAIGPNEGTTNTEGDMTQLPQMRNEQCWTMDQMQEQIRRDAKRRREEAAAAAALAAQKVAEEASNAAADLAGGGSNSQTPSKDGPLSGNPVREWEDHAHPIGTKMASRQKELISMSKWNRREIATVFEETFPPTARRLRYLKAFRPIFSSFPRRRHVTISDGMFGCVANYISQYMGEGAQVLASEISAQTLAIAKDRLKVIPAYRKLAPSLLGLDDESTDFVYAYELLSHEEKYERAISEMMRVARRGIALIEPHDTNLDAQEAKRFFSKQELREALTPLSGIYGVGSGERLDVNTLASTASSKKWLLLIKPFRTGEDRMVAERATKAGAKPFQMIAAIMLRKRPDEKLLDNFIKAGYMITDTDKGGVAKEKKKKEGKSTGKKEKTDTKEKKKDTKETGDDKKKKETSKDKKKDTKNKKKEDDEEEETE